MHRIDTVDGDSVTRPTTLARSFMRRFVGLLARRRLDEAEGLLLQPGGSIHTIGMRFAIDAVFLDADLVILKVIAHVRPLRIALAPRKTHAVLEMSAGRAVACALRPGMQLKLSEEKS
jgi:uncharacterized membrane protein (UPF0127 family)